MTPAYANARATWLLLCLVCAAPVACAQTIAHSVQPVHWSAEPPAAVPARARFQVVLRATIDPGWHLYALQQPEGGPAPTEISLAWDDPANLLRVDQDRPVRATDAQFHLQTPYFTQAARFTLRLQARDLTAAAKALHVFVRYQCCNDRVCLPPHEEALPVPVRFRP